MPRVVLNCTLRCKALNIFSAQHSHQYIITAWMMLVHFDAVLFDCSGEKELLGYDLSLERDLQGDVWKLMMNEEWYSVINIIFSSDDL